MAVNWKCNRKSGKLHIWNKTIVLQHPYNDIKLDHHHHRSCLNNLFRLKIVWKVIWTEGVLSDEVSQNINISNILKQFFFRTRNKCTGIMRPMFTWWDLCRPVWWHLDRAVFHLHTGWSGHPDKCGKKSETKIHLSLNHYTNSSYQSHQSAASGNKVVKQF